MLKRIEKTRWTQRFHYASLRKNVASWKWKTKIRSSYWHRNYYVITTVLCNNYYVSPCYINFKIIMLSLGSSFRIFLVWKFNHFGIFVRSLSRCYYSSVKVFPGTLIMTMTMWSSKITSFAKSISLVLAKSIA